MRTKTAHRKYMTAYYKKRRANLIQQLGGRCAICGSTENLEFDHIESKDKEFSISEHICHDKEKLNEEIRKCQLLCHACHVKKSKRCNDFGWKATIEIAKQIRDDYIHKKITQRELSSFYHIGQSEISAILRGTRWKECKEDGLQDQIDAKRSNARHYIGLSVDKLDSVSESVICTYNSMGEAKKDGFKVNHIAECCRGLAKSHGGYKWRFHT